MPQGGEFDPMPMPQGGEFDQMPMPQSGEPEVQCGQILTIHHYFGEVILMHMRIKIDIIPFLHHDDKILTGI